MMILSKLLQAFLLLSLLTCGAQGQEALDARGAREVFDAEKAFARDGFERGIRASPTKEFVSARAPKPARSEPDWHLARALPRHADSAGTRIRLTPTRIFQDQHGLRHLSSSALILTFSRREKELSLPLGEKDA